MSGIMDTIRGLFSSSGTIKKTPFYTLRPKLAQWQEHRSYSLYSALPSGITFSSYFWTRIHEIHRHTSGDGHERAVTVWWADGEFVLTENIRGETSKVQIPRHRVQVQYKPVKGTRRYERIILVDGKVHRKKSVDIETVKRIKKVDVQYLFNMHTHPPHDEPGDTVDKNDYFFSAVDIRSFLGSGSAITGLVTDKLWVIIRTNETPSNTAIDDSGVISPEFLRDQLRLKVYKAEFGKTAVSYDFISPRAVHG